MNEKGVGTSSEGTTLVKANWFTIVNFSCVVCDSSFGIVQQIAYASSIVPFRKILYFAAYSLYSTNTVGPKELQRTDPNSP